jgi:hypothetical protein
MAGRLLLALGWLGRLGFAQYCASDYVSLTVYQLKEFMATPFAPVWESAEAIATESFDFLSESELRQWFLHQIRLHEAVGDGYRLLSIFSA